MFFNTIGIYIAVIFEKISHMDKKQVVFEQLTSSDFKIGSYKYPQQLQYNNDHH